MTTVDRGHAAPHDLVVVVADHDVEMFLGAVLNRAVDRRCLRPIRWIVRRDPMRDAGVLQAPCKAIPDVRPGTSRVLVLLDHHGCGRDDVPAPDLEGEVKRQLERAGHTKACCIVLEPELEVVLLPVWDRVADLLAKKRPERPSPTRLDVLTKIGIVLRRDESEANRWAEATRGRPKECFGGLLRCLNLRHQPRLFEEIAEEVSLPALKKGDAGGRLAAKLVEWFGASTDTGRNGDG